MINDRYGARHPLSGALHHALRHAHRHHGRRRDDERPQNSDEEYAEARFGERGGGRGERGFGRGRGRFFMGGGDGLPGGRRLGSADLQLILLALLAEKPAHGYELIRMLEERSGGFYAPSPGMIYPALTYLEEIEHAAVTPEGNRKLYAATAAGLAHLEANRAEATLILDTLARIGSRMAQVREAYAGIADVDPGAADELFQARHALKHALSRARGAAPDETRRIARILDRATAEILGRPS